MSSDATWWTSAVFYQIYPRSWQDSDGDGIGDLGGVIDRLDHLEWLGVDGVWLNPTMSSPNHDWGYDVTDYRGVHPDLGRPEDLTELVKQADARDIKVLLDLVPNHTSSAHPWFVDASSSRTAQHRDWYFWADAAPDGGPPNNWTSVFAGEPAWEWHEPTQQYYLHNYLASQPDLNWWNEEVRAEFRDIIRYWLDNGIAGFRIDVAHALISDRELRDNPAATDADPFQVRRIGQQQVYNMNRPETHDILRDWREVCEGHQPPGILVGETYVYDPEQLALFYGSGVDELNLAFNFPFIFTRFEATALRETIEATLHVLPQHATPVWTGSNHDTSRFPSRWCNGDRARIRSALLMLLTLPGASFLYYGDEIGMTDVAVAQEDIQDPVGLRRWPEPGRDPVRTPMRWTDEPGAGFTRADVSPWLPIGDARHPNVHTQLQDPQSTLHLTRDLVALRRATSDLKDGRYSPVETPPGVYGWRRGDSIVCALNTGDESQTLPLSGEILICTDRTRDGAAIDTLTLGPAEAVVIRTSGIRSGSTAT